MVIRVEEFPDAETEQEMELDSPFDILGLYRGVALPRKSVLDARAEPDIIFLYRRPILDYWCETGEDLYHLVRHVLIHEIGHHFGFSDDDMERIEAHD
ncbi:MAG TPA: metallopeptidase family protein [Stellaceae bacterium]|nr:metallopeptidase family protein [Stellaceae bacterium]